MRLLIATHARGAIGGVESYLRGVAPLLAARRHELALLYEKRYEGVPAPDPYAACVAEWDAGEMGIAGALQAARAWRPERIWVNSVPDPVLEAGLLELAPAVLFAHNYEGLCATGEKFQRWPRPRPCARTLGAGCFAVNFTQHCGVLRPARFAARWSAQRAHARHARRYERILVASRAMQREWDRQLGGTGPTIECLPYPCLEPREDAPPPRQEKPSRLLMLARLTAGKGGALLLDAMKATEATLDRPLSLVIAGNGPELPRLRTRAQRLGLQVEFPGWLDTLARREAFEAADVLVIPSIWPEPFGLTGLEAAAHAVPTVAFATGGIPDWLVAGVTGEAAPVPPSAAGLAAALVRAVGEANHWQALRRAAWEQRERCAALSVAAHVAQLEAALALQTERPAGHA